MEQRNLSGIFIRFKNPETGRWENWTIEDIPAEERRKILEGRDKEWLVRLSMSLSDTLRKVGDQFDISAQ